MKWESYYKSLLRMFSESTNKKKTWILEKFSSIFDEIGRDTDLFLFTTGLDVEDLDTLEEYFLEDVK